MKILKYILIIAIGALFGFQELSHANEGHTPVYGWQCNQLVKPYDRLTYVKLGMGSILSSSHNGVGPAVGIGRRYEFGELGVDVSVNFTKGGKNAYYVSLPRVLMLYYFQPNQPRSFYVGAGGSIAWTQIKTKGKRVPVVYSTYSYDDEFYEEEVYYKNKTKRRNFGGLMAEACVGYELGRDKPIRSFVELGVGHAALPFDGKFVNKFNPVMTVTYGFGF